jgi:hypothetical protein
MMIVTDSSWETNGGSGPIVYDSTYFGEQYDARLEADIAGWATPRFQYSRSTLQQRYLSSSMSDSSSSSSSSGSSSRTIGSARTRSNTTTTTATTTATSTTDSANIGEGEQAAAESKAWVPVWVQHLQRKPYLSSQLMQPIKAVHEILPVCPLITFDLLWIR